MIVDIFLLLFLRTQYFYLLPAICITFLLFLGILNFKSIKLILFLFTAFVFGLFFVNMLIAYDIDSSLLRYINNDMIFRASYGGSAYLTEIEYTSWIDILKLMPLRVLYFVFGPFPWMITNVFTGLAFLENLFFILLLIISFSKSFRNLWILKKKYFLFLLCYAIIGFIGNAIIDSNFGTAIRHKLCYIFVFFIFSSFELKNYNINYFKVIKTFS